MLPAENTPFVVFGDDWSRHPSTMQHTLRHVATKYPLIWINGIGHSVPGLNVRHLKRAWEKATQIVRSRSAPPPPVNASLGGGVPAAIIQPRVLPWHNVSAIHAFNTRSLTRAITERLRALGLTRPPILITGSPPSVGVVGQLGEAASVYFCMDDFLAFPSYTASMLGPLENRLLEKVDLLVATAASLTKSKLPRSGRAYHLPQGVNYAHFSEPRPEPAEFASIPGPRIGFAGGVGKACDVELLARLADAFPDVSLVFVGPVSLDEPALAKFRRPNVHRLGMRPYDELPAYVQHFDVGIIPYALSAWTVAVDPLKLLEYLAAGIPVVTTSIPEAAKYAEYVGVAGDHDAFIDRVRQALASDRQPSRNKGQSLARANTWETRADTLLSLVGDFLAESAAPRVAAAAKRLTRV